MKKCPACGNVTDSQFCGNCGADLRDISETELLNEQEHSQAENAISEEPIVDVVSQQNDGSETSKKISETISEVAPVAADTVKPKKKKNIFIAIGVVAVVAIALIAIVVIGGNASKKEDYKNNLALAQYSMTSYAAIAEKQCNLISSVWNDAIFENTNNADTKKYVAGAADFNEALANLFADESFKSNTTNLEEGLGIVKSEMDKLKNPPDEYKEIYNYMLDVYTDFAEFVGLATDPTGSYNSYTEKFHELDSSLAKSLNKLEAMMP